MIYLSKGGAGADSDHTWIHPCDRVLKHVLALGCFDTACLMCSLLNTWEWATAAADEERRSQNSCTAPCNGIISHGVPIRGIRVFANHTHRNKRKQNAPTIFACLAVFLTCLSPNSECSTYTPDEWQLFKIAEKNPKTPYWSPMPV